MSMRCGSAKIFCNESCTLCDQFSQFEKNTVHVKNVSTIWLAFSACVAFSVTHTKIRVMSELHSLKFQRTTKLFKQMEL